MNTKLLKEIQDEQDHGRQKYGKGPLDFDHDDALTNADWHACILRHNDLAVTSTPLDRREHLVKIAGLAISAIESHDRKNA